MHLVIIAAHLVAKITIVIFMTFVPHKKKPLLARILEWLNDSEEWPVWVQFFLLPRPLGRENFFAARVVLLVAMAFFTLQAIAGGYESWIAQFLHNLNLPVHETGHKPVLTSLGGSLFQTIMPLVFCFALWIKPRDLFGASIALWWAFENLIDVAPYIEDALPMKLMLISGGTGAEAPYGFHDWNFILSETGLLLKCDSIASAVYAVGYLGMALCVLWGTWSLLYYVVYQRK